MFAYNENDSGSTGILLLQDDDGELELIRVGNYDSRFDICLAELVDQWKASDGEFFEVIGHLREKGYLVEILPYKSIHI